jgi:DNA-directed RNA polymerase specialized sigma24 family protein
MPPDAGSVTHWLGRLCDGDAGAAGPLWERYFARLVGLARARLAGLPRRAADEEDVALSAFDSFCRDARAGRFPDLTDRDGLWRLLLTITAQKAADLVRRERAGKRGAGAAPLGGDVLGEIAGTEPTPEFAALAADQFRALMDRLDDDELREVALRKMEGHTNDEIAAALGCVPRTVERRLSVIRSLWSVPDECG